MLNLNEKDQWLFTYWEFTYKVSWPQICKAAQRFYDDLHQVEILVDQKPIQVDSKDAINQIEEARNLTIRGISRLYDAPMMITFYNQTKAVDVTLPTKSSKHDLTDYQTLNIFLTHYLTSKELGIYLDFFD